MGSESRRTTSPEYTINSQMLLPTAISHTQRTSPLQITSLMSPEAFKDANRNDEINEPYRMPLVSHRYTVDRLSMYIPQRHLTVADIPTNTPRDFGHEFRENRMLTNLTNTSGCSTLSTLAESSKESLMQTSHEIEFNYAQWLAAQQTSGQLFRSKTWSPEKQDYSGISFNLNKSRALPNIRSSNISARLHTSEHNLTPACNHHSLKLYAHNYDGTKIRRRYPLMFSDNDANNRTGQATLRRNTHSKRQRAFADKDMLPNDNVSNHSSIKAS